MPTDRPPSAARPAAAGPLARRAEAAFLEQHERERAWLDVLSRKELRAFVATLEVLANRHRPDDPDRSARLGR